MEPYVCPAGFDCILASSCPAPILPCPAGYFCSTYEGNEYQSEIDYEYAQLIDGDSTRDDAWMYSERGRYVQVSCLQEFSCPQAEIINVCAEGHWCSENTVEQTKCDDLSLCPISVGYQINFIDVLIMILMTLTVTICSYLLVRRQQKQQISSRLLPSKDALLEGRASLISTGKDSSTIGIKIAFKELSCMKGNNLILPSISGTIPSSKITCILGPMSCGKSTFLEALRTGGRDCSGGSICLVRQDTQERIPLSQYPQFVGLVPQEDILDRALTVRETLMFNAVSRVPALYYDRERAEQVVDRVLSDLAIRHIAGTVIGGGPNSPANISGGQVKRVNIACELVALTRPGVLLLDEPTSGLDASVALDLVNTLKTVAASGITIVMVLQQPRTEIFDSLDQLFLMQLGGQLVYQGASTKAAAYLTTAGYQQPEETSDADFCIDVLNDIIDVARLSVDASRVSIQSNSFIDLTRCWEKSDFARDIITEIDATLDKFPQRSRPESQNSSVWEDLKDQFHMHFRIFDLNVRRLWTIRLRNRQSLLTYFAIHVIMAIALSSGFSIIIQGSYSSVLVPPVSSQLSLYYPSPLVVEGYNHMNVGDFGFRQLLFFMSGTIGCAAGLAAVPVFSGGSALFNRETQSGVPVVSSSLGKMWGDVVFVVWNSMVFCGVWTAFGHAGSYIDWIAVIVATSFASSGIGYICGVLSTPANASVYCIIATFAFCVFSGVEPSLRQVQGLPVLNLAWYLSFATWTAEATYITWTSYLRNGHGEDTVPIAAHNFGFEVDSYGRSIGSLIAIGIAMRVLTILIQYYKSKS